MPGSIQTTFLYLTAGLCALALVFFLVSWRLFRRSRTDVFWRRRREAGQRGWRLFLLAAALLGLSGLFCAATAISAVLSDENEVPASAGVRIEAGTGSVMPGESATPTLTETLTPEDAASSTAGIVPTTAVSASETPVQPPEAPTMTATPEVVIITATPVYTPTETPFPTFTPHITPPVSSVTPRPHAEIVITALDDQISDDLTPVNSRVVFEAGITRMYMFVEFKDMSQGVLWKRLLYRDGELIDGNSYLWGPETRGTAYFFFGNDGGFVPGNYEIHVLIGDDPAPVNIASFTVSE